MNAQTRFTPRSHLVRLLCALAVAASGLFLGQPSTASAATFTVTKTSDSKDGVCNSDCSLREAIIAAHQLAGVDTITLPAGTYQLTLSDLDITSSLTIAGAGAATTIIENIVRDRVFEVRPDITVTIDKVTVRNGFIPSGTGGGIYNAGTLTLSNSVVSDNSVLFRGDGGAIFNSGTLTIARSAITNNTAESGAGIYSTGTIAITNSTISGNSTHMSDSGGGIYNKGTVSLSHSTVSSNTAYYGGGIYNEGTVSLSHSTVSGNRADGQEGTGGGIHSRLGARTTIVNSTISGNSANYGGGGIAQILWDQTTGGMTLHNVTITNNNGDNDHDGDGDGGGLLNIIDVPIRDPMKISNTIIAGNIAVSTSPDCSGTLNSQGYNLIGNKTGCTISGDTTGNKLNVDPQLGPLQNNGGPTQTHLPAVGSPAVDGGNPATPGSGGTACLTTDQRGQPRPTDGNGNGTIRCDIGAVER